MEINSQEYVFPAEAFEALQDTDEDERTHEQKIALENLSRHLKISDTGTLENLYEELGEVEGLKDKHIYKLLEIVPQHESTVRSIFSKERVRLEDEDIEQILDVCTSVELEE